MEEMVGRIDQWSVWNIQGCYTCTCEWLEHIGFNILDVLNATTIMSCALLKNKLKWSGVVAKIQNIEIERRCTLTNSMEKNYEKDG